MTTDHAQLSLPDIRGPVTDLFGKLAGSLGPVWLEALCRFLRKQNPWPAPQPPIHLCVAGTPAVEASIEELKKAGVGMENCVEGLFCRRILKGERGRFFRLAVIKPEDLRLPDGAECRAKDITGEADRRGYALMPPGLALIVFTWLFLDKGWSWVRDLDSVFIRVGSFHDELREPLMVCASRVGGRDYVLSFRDQGERVIKPREGFMFIAP